VEASHNKEIFCDEAFVLERERTGETSLRLRLLSRDHGLLNARAKGALAPQKPWGRHIDLYCRIEFTAAPMRNIPLVYLRESRLLDPSRHLAVSPEALHTAAYAAHVLLRSLQPHYPCEPLFDLYRKLLDYMRKKEPSWLLVKRYELRVLAYLGHDPGDADARLTGLMAEHCHVSPLTRSRLQKQLADLQRRMRHQETYWPGTPSAG